MRVQNSYARCNHYCSGPHGPYIITTEICCISEKKKNFLNFQNVAQKSLYRTAKYHAKKRQKNLNQLTVVYRRARQPGGGEDPHVLT